jgi:hypothetical protein
MRDSGFTWIIIGLLVLGALAAASSEPATDAAVPAPQFKVGDSWAYKYPFRAKTITYAVTEVAKNRVTMKRSDYDFGHQVIMSAEGNAMRTVIGDANFEKYDPEMPLLRFPLYLGKSWSENITVAAAYPPYLSGPARVMMTVSKWEDISVPAGKFRALKIIGQYESAYNTTGIICWYAPEVKNFASCVFTRRQEENFELLKFEAGK